MAAIKLSSGLFLQAKINKILEYFMVFLIKTAIPRGHVENERTANKADSVVQAIIPFPTSAIW